MNDLTTRLSELADEVADTNVAALRDRVQISSRRLRRRRTILTSLAGVCVVAVLVAGGRVLLAFRGDLAPGPASTTEGVVWVSADPQVTEAVARALPGTLTYLKVEPGRPVQLITVSNSTDQINAGTKTTTTFGRTSQTEPFVGAVSPDHSKLVVIESPAGAQVGDLIVMEPGGARRTLASNVFWGGGVWPVWTPDSTAVIVRIGGTWTRVDVASRAATSEAGLGAGSGYITWSANGQRLAYSDGSDLIAVSLPDGTGRREASVAGLPECQQTVCPFAVQAVSDDGRYVALGHGNTDPSHVDQAHLVFDLQTQQLVSLPPETGTPSHVYFRPGGGLVIRSVPDGGNATLYLVNADRTVAGTLPDPVTGDTSRLVSYRR